MKQMIALIKTNLKLLFRNKGFLFFLFVLPVLSASLLNIKAGIDISAATHSTQVINELLDVDAKIVYLAEENEAFYHYRVKVFDSSKSELTDHLLNQLIATGLFTVYRYDSTHMTEGEILQKAEENAYFDRIGTILYFSQDFEKEILEAKLNKSVKISHASEDERDVLLEESLKQSMSVLLETAGYANGSVEQLLEIVDETSNFLPDKKIVRISRNTNLSLTPAQKGFRQSIGYSYAVMTLSFLFCGIFIASTIIEERENKVFTRIALSDTNEYQYILSKLIVSVLVSVIQAVIMGIGIFIVVKNEFGISRFHYLFLIFMLGIIFNTLSLCIGAIMGDIMGANYLVYSVWTISSLLSGLYFSIENTSGVFQNISNLMPQKWFLRAAEMMMVGDLSAITLVMCVTAAFLIFILSAGAAGLQLKYEE